MKTEYEWTIGDRVGGLAVSFFSWVSVVVNFVIIFDEWLTDNDIFDKPAKW